MHAGGSSTSDLPLPPDAPAPRIPIILLYSRALSMRRSRLQDEYNLFLEALLAYLDLEVR